MIQNAYGVAALLLVAAVLCLFAFSFKRTVRFVMRFLFRMLCGIGAISVFNLIAAAYGFCIGLNVYTCSLCGIFGLPGYLLLVGTRIIC